MEILSFDTLLTNLCDSFDELISPKRIARSNRNIIYLIFKAIAKGFEVINNICIVLSNKFNPAKCSDEDLESVASLVGTERLEGSASGLEIVIANTGNVSRTLASGIYTYFLDDDTKFIFELVSDLTIASGDTHSEIAMSENIGIYPVTAQSDIDVIYSGGDVPEDIKFSCYDNAGLLGTPAETDLAFRERILTDTTRQNTIKELELKLKNLPYLYDAKIVFNQSMGDIGVGSVIIPPYYMAIFFNGSARNEIAEIVARGSIYPTVSSVNSKELRYISDVFVDGYYIVNVIPFTQLLYDLVVNYKIDTTYISLEKARAEITAFLQSNFRVKVHSGYIKEEDIYNKLKEFNVSGPNHICIK